MFGSTILEVAIGLTFVYILLAILVSEIIELISSRLHWRADTLQMGIKTLLNNTPDPNDSGNSDDPASSSRASNDNKEIDLADNVLKHPLIKQLARSKHGPSYVPARNFALALFDEIPKSTATGINAFTTLRTRIENMPKGSLRTSLLAEVNSASGDMDRARDNIEKWFDDSMDRVSGWYTRKTRMMGLILAIIVVVVINADTLMIANTLVKDDAKRDALVEAAGNPDFPEAKLKQWEDLGLPIGWSLSDPERGFPTDGALVGKVIGLLITGLAVSLGAPFWFGFLSRLMSARQGLRQGGAPPQPSQPRLNR